MNKTVWLVALSSLLLIAGACQGRGPKASNSATETIAPPAPQPAPTGTDAMTQTVDIEDSRSEDDGGVLTSSQTAKVPGSTATTSTTSSKTTASKTTTKKKTKK